MWYTACNVTSGTAPKPIVLTLHTSKQSYGYHAMHSVACVRIRKRMCVLDNTSAPRIRPHMWNSRLDCLHRRCTHPMSMRRLQFESVGHLPSRILPLQMEVTPPKGFLRLCRCIVRAWGTECTSLWWLSLLLSSSPYCRYRKRWTSSCCPPKSIHII